MNAFRRIFSTPRYLAVAIFFLSLSLFYCAWIAYIPYYCDGLSLSEGELGIALFFSAIGSFVMIFLSNWIIHRFGAGFTTFFAMIYFGLTIYFPALAFDFSTFCIALFFLGTGSSLLNISMNSMVGIIEKEDNSRIMSTFHGFYSVGTMIGSGMGSLLAARFMSPFWHISVLFILLFIAQLLLFPYYRSIKSANSGDNRFSFKFNGIQILFPIALIGLIVMVSEGAVADWGALYLKNEVIVEPLGYSLGYALFAFAMAFGRFSGDWISERVTSWKIVVLGCSVGLFGFWLLLIGFVVPVYIGFFLIGLGFSVIVPEVFRVAAKTEGINTAMGVSFIAGVANLGFLVGPMFLGFLAEWQTIRFSFFVLSMFVLLAMLMAIKKVYRN